jgi:hypothetical protein
MLIVVGGHSRSVGKTSVVAGLIAALPEFEWTALKITQHGHGICSADGAPCHCATADHTWAISEERDRTGKSDTSRFLVAGARRVWWVRTQQGRLAEAMPRVRHVISDAGYIIIESNSILRFLRPDLYLTVLHPATTDFKHSAQEFLDRASAVLLHQGEDISDPRWQHVSLRSVTGKPVFAIRAPNYVTDELVSFVRSAIKSKAGDYGNKAG